MRPDHFEVLTEDSIAVLIEAFYARVRRHPRLAPIFATAIRHDEWPEHLATMRRFWSSVMLGSGTYSGNPVAVHRAVQGLERSLFTEWLALFADTAAELFEPAIASVFSVKAQRIAMSLQLAVFHRPDQPPEGLTRGPPV